MKGTDQMKYTCCEKAMVAIKWMGGALYRTETLAAGGDCCGNNFLRKG